jgi:hypothetical protein
MRLVAKVISNIASLKPHAYGCILSPSALRMRKGRFAYSRQALRCGLCAIGGEDSMRSTKVAFGLVAAAAFLLANCAQFSSGAPTAVTALSRDQLATLHLKDIITTAPPGLSQADLTRLTDAIRTEVAFASPGIFVEQSKITVSQALTMRLQFTAYRLEISASDNTANALIQSFQAGFTEGQLGLRPGTIVVAKGNDGGCSAVRTIAADIQLVDDNNIVKGQYRVEKQGDIPCNGQSLPLESDKLLTTGFAKTVAEIVKK